MGFNSSNRWPFAAAAASASSTCTMDLHTGVAPWREAWTTRRQERCKGVWDALLQRETLILRDGRRLSYFLDGPSSATTTARTTSTFSKTVDSDEESQDEASAELPYIFVFHAMCLTGNSFLMAEAPTDYVLVCVNRPGYIGSDLPPQDGSYTHESFADDIEQLADHLHVPKFYVAGHSSGGPCALACAAHLPHRVLGVGLLSSDPEYAHPSAPNKKLFNAFCIGTMLPLFMEHCLCFMPMAKHSSRGMRNDYRMDTSPYTFQVETDIKQPVLIYVGEDDTVLPVSIAQHVQTRLVNSHLEIVPNIGHLSLLRDAVLSEFFESLLYYASDRNYFLSRKMNRGATTEDTRSRTLTTSSTDTSTGIAAPLIPPPPPASSLELGVVVADVASGVFVV